MRFYRDVSGVTSIEYALIASLIAVVIIVSVAAAGSTLDVAFADVAARLGETAGDGSTDRNGS